MKRSTARRRWSGVRALVSVGVLLLVAAGGLLWARATPPEVEGAAPGQLEARQALVDLGRVPFDQLVEGHFELTNSGRQTVRLLGKPEVRTLEGC